jgi:hypothetical protein
MALARSDNSQAMPRKIDVSASVAARKWSSNTSVIRRLDRSPFIALVNQGERTISSASKLLFASKASTGESGNSTTKTVRQQLSLV